MSVMENFEISCKKCGSKNIEKEDSRGYSKLSGSWGSIDFVCLECGNREAFEDDY